MECWWCYQVVSAPSCPHHHSIARSQVAGECVSEPSRSGYADVHSADADADEDEDDPMADQEPAHEDGAPAAAAQAVEQHAQQLIEQLQEAGPATPQRSCSFTARLESAQLAGQVGAWHRCRPACMAFVQAQRHMAEAERQAHRRCWRLRPDFPCWRQLRRRSVQHRRPELWIHSSQHARAALALHLPLLSHYPCPAHQLAESTIASAHDRWLQVTLHLPYPYYRPRLKLLSMYGDLEASTPGLSQQALAEFETSIEASVHGGPAVQSLAWLVARTLLSMQSMRTKA